MKNLLLLLIAFISLSVYSQNTKPLNIGEIKTIQSKVLNEERTLNVYLPQSYDSKKEYPVIYLLDGSINEDFLHITGLVQFFNMMFNMPDCIVVGIANVDRKRDFTFHTDLKDLQADFPTTGNSEPFIRFIETELQPFVEKSYKTTNAKYIIGQSLGGLLATEILLKKPQLFTHYLIVSPSLWWDNESMLNEAKAMLEKQTHNPEYVYVAVGKGEAKIMRDEAEKLAKLLKEVKKNLRTDYVLMTDENHATILHNSIYKAFSKLFPYEE